jgi:hypothetical protein
MSGRWCRACVCVVADVVHCPKAVETRAWLAQYRIAILAVHRAARPPPWDVPSVGPVKAWARRRDPVNDPLWKHYPIAMLFAKRLDNKGSKNNARTCAVGSSMLLIGTEL